MDKKRLTIRISIALLTAAFLFLLVNAPYFIKKFQYSVYSASKDYPEVHDSRLIKYFSGDSAKKDFGPMKKDHIRIESLNIDAPIIYPEEENEAEYQRSLEYGVVQYPGSARAGEFGNLFIFGHSSDYLLEKGDYKTVFALLPNIEIGEIIQISDSSNKIFRYRVTQKMVASKSETNLLNQDKSKKELTVQTSYPIGTALKRFVVKAILVE